MKITTPITNTGIGGSRGTRVATGATYQAATAAREALLSVAEKLLGWPKADTLSEE